MRSFPLCLALPLIAVTASAAERPAPPNIVLILADDYGFGSSNPYGATGLQTPHLDRLTREGRLFTNAYAPSSVCTPTRYGLLTGRYYWRSPIKDGEVLSPGGGLLLEQDRPTLATLVRDQGYRTAVFGKWHLGLTSGPVKDWSQPLVPGPGQVGFDHVFGLAGNITNGPHNFITDDEVLEQIPGEPVVVENNRTTKGLRTQWEPDRVMDTLTTRAAEWIEANRAAPFFVYFAPTAVHGPIVPHGRFTGSPYGKYGDFITELDWSLGQLLAALDRLQLAENSIVIFTSDNGGVLTGADATAAQEAGLSINGPLRGGKHTEWEGGFREPFLVRWPGRVPAGTVSDQVICLTDMMATVASVLRVPVPAGAGEDSFDLLPAFTEAQPGAPVRDHVILQSADGTYAIRSGDWKLVERIDAPAFEPNRNRRTVEAAEHRRAAAFQRDELFNLGLDPQESQDVWVANQERAAALKKILVEARERGFTRPDPRP